MADRWAWSHAEWARIERVALEHREARDNVTSHKANNVGGLRLKTAQAITRDTAMELRGWAHVASSPFSNDLIRARRAHVAMTHTIAGVPAFDPTQPCLMRSHTLVGPAPTMTYCARCKNPHHACDGGGVSASGSHPLPAQHNDGGEHG